MRSNQNRPQFATVFMYDDYLLGAMLASVITAILLVTYTPFTFVVLVSVDDLPFGKMVRDWNYIALHYSEERAICYAEYFLNSLIASHIVLAFFFAFRVSRRSIPVAFGEVWHPLAKRVLAGATMVIVLGGILYLFRSFLKESGEISGIGFGPNFKAVIVNMLFFVGNIMSLHFFFLHILAATGVLNDRAKDEP